MWISGTIAAQMDKLDTLMEGFAAVTKTVKDLEVSKNFMHKGLADMKKKLKLDERKKHRDTREDRKRRENSSKSKCNNV